MRVAARGNGLEEVVHQDGVYHGSFVDDQEVAFQRGFIVFLEASLLDTVIQQAVNGFGLVAGGLAHSLGGPARGSRQQKFDPGLGEDFEDGIDDGGFAGPRPPGNHHHLVGEGTLHRFHLPGCQGDVELLLHPGKGLFGVDGPDGLGAFIRVFKRAAILVSLR